jgi:hypothetical protein
VLLGITEMGFNIQFKHSFADWAPLALGD